MRNRTELPLPADAADGNIRRRGSVPDARGPRVAEASVAAAFALCSAGFAAVVVGSDSSSGVACEGEAQSSRGGDAWIPKLATRRRLTRGPVGCSRSQGNSKEY